MPALTIPDDVARAMHDPYRPAVIRVGGPFDVWAEANGLSVWRTSLCIPVPAYGVVWLRLMVAGGCYAAPLYCVAAASHVNHWDTDTSAIARAWRLCQDHVRSCFS